MRAMNPRTIRAICFDLDNTLWETELVLVRAERILADWLKTRYPKVTARFSTAEMQHARLSLLREEPHNAHDLTYLRRESLARLAELAGYERRVGHEAFAFWHEARNRVEPFADVLPALESLKHHFRLATLTNGNADLERIGLAHHFEVRLAAEHIGCAKPDPRAYVRLADALTLPPAEILFVGDEPHADVVGPRAAGMQTVWVNRRRDAWPAELEPADLTIDGLDELVALLTPQSVNRAPSL